MKQFLIIVFTFICLTSQAQQGLQLDIGEIDSSEMELQRQLEYYQLISGTFASNILLDEIKLPEFNTQSVYLQRFKVNIELFPVSDFLFAGLSSGPFSANSPFYHNGVILSEQAYQLGDKFVIGGFSYGANSIHNTAYPNQQSNYFDTYGSTMFMQYKVSKNFRIETSVSVGQQHGPIPGF